MPPRSIKSLRETMPIIYSNEGVWEGWYRYFDIDGNKIDEHRSRLLCRFPDENTYLKLEIFQAVLKVIDWFFIL
jgi:hypothetical protein